jgi:hypothetical protein
MSGIGLPGGRTSGGWGCLGSGLESTSGLGLGCGLFSGRSGGRAGNWSIWRLPEPVLPIADPVELAGADKIVEQAQTHDWFDSEEAHRLAEMKAEPWHLAIGTDDHGLQPKRGQVRIDVGLLNSHVASGGFESHV